MNVHEAISTHSRKQYTHLEIFKQLDEQREQAIEEAISLCKAGSSFSVNSINQITRQINTHALNGISPIRMEVSEEMVREFVSRHK